MKIKPEHYAHIRDAIAARFNAGQVKGYTARIEAEGKAKYVAKRVRWDFMWHAVKSEWVCDTLYPYANDDHIDTALRSIMRELFPD